METYQPIFEAIITFFPTVLLHGLNDDDKQQGEEMEPFANVATRQLKQVLFVKLLENAALDFDELEKKKQSKNRFLKNKLLLCVPQ